MKISEYPKIDQASSSDLLVISGIAGDRQITVGNLMIHRPPSTTSPERFVTLTADGWDTATNRQTVVVPGILGNTVFMWDVAFHTTRDEYLRFLSAGIRSVAQAADQVTFQCFFFKPDMPITLRLWLM